MNTDRKRCRKAAPFPFGEDKAGGNLNQEKEWESNLTSEYQEEEKDRKSSEVSRSVRNAASAIRYLLQLPPVESVAQGLEDLGVPDCERTNMVALQANLFNKAMSGDLKSYEALMKMGGYEAPSGRTSEQEEKITTSGANGTEDVFIYLPQIEEDPPKSGNSIESDQPKTGG